LRCRIHFCCSNRRGALIIWQRRLNGASGSLQSERHGSPHDSTARKWLTLIERRQQSFVEFWHTGRWQHYYTHAQFHDEMRKVLDLRNHWA
jgi:hypothetical protein